MKHHFIVNSDRYTLLPVAWCNYDGNNGWVQVNVLTEPSQPPSLSNAPRLISPPCCEHNKQEDKPKDATLFNFQIKKFRCHLALNFAFSGTIKTSIARKAKMFH